jgi:hypothetical protein
MSVKKKMKTNYLFITIPNFSRTYSAHILHVYDGLFV